MRAISFLTAVSALALVAVPASAGTYSAQGVDVVDAAVVLHVIPEDRSDVAVESAAGPRLAAPQARMDGGRLIIDGNVRVTGCGSTMGHEPTVRVAGVGSVRKSDLPVVTLHTPRQLDLSTHGAVFADIGASSGGHFASNGCGDSSIGAASGDLALDTRGSGDIELASVAGALQAALQGSGDLRGRDAGGVHLALTGSGDVWLGNVGNALDASLAGSGDVRIASVSGGAVALSLAGSGDMRVDRGEATRLDASLAGSGDMSFGGHVGVLAARLGGSGDMHIASADHIDTLHKGGSGDITIGD